MTTSAAWLLLALLCGHFLADFTPLATDRMQAAKAAGGPLGPIAAHAAVHAAFVAAIVGLAARPAPALVAGVVGFEFATHFVIDALRARLGARVPILSDPSQREFWTFLGFDQLLHAAVLVAIAWAVS